MSNNGFSIIELMSVAAIVAIIFAIAMYGYIGVRGTSRKVACVANLEKIDAAIDQWALDNHIHIGAPIAGSEEDIYGDYVKGGHPKCPAGGEYVFHAVGSDSQVTCSKENEGHKRP